MDAKTIDEMTLDELRIAVAESQGWIHLRECDRIPAGLNKGYYYAMYPEGRPRYSLPEFSTSRDALAPVLAKLTRPKQFIHQLWIATGKTGCEFDYDSVWRIAAATPEQICRAYLKCLL